ncbi:MAG: dicarboxylate/amino acid:cation symporter, partial [Alkalibacterium sp.]
MEKRKKLTVGLVPKLLIAIGLGVLIGQMTFIPDFILQIPITFSALFSRLLAFIILAIIKA